MESFPWLTAMTAVPLAGAAATAIFGGSSAQRAHKIALCSCLASLVLAILVRLRFDETSAGIQLTERAVWIPSLGIEYLLGVDGLSIMLLLLTAIVTPLALMAPSRIQERHSAFYSLALFLQAALFGAFTALNFFHWFIFWELSLIPAFFLIKLWGGQARGRAALQFFLYTLAGSVCMLLAFLAIFHATGTFDFERLAEMGRSGYLKSALAARLGWYSLSSGELAAVIFLGVLIGFAVKVPLMPLHTWLPPAYTEAPVGVTILLTALMSKLGVYGVARIVLPIFSGQISQLLTPLLWVAAITSVAAACATFAQRDIKRMLAYSSINHLGYCMLGLFAACGTIQGTSALFTERTAILNGVAFLMFSHGITATALFCFVGFLESRTGGLRSIDDFGGLRQIVPVFCGLMGISLMASLGLPGLSGFIGEFLIFKGVFALAPWPAAFAALGLLITAVYVLTLLQKVFHGPLNERWRSMPDLNQQERLLILPVIAIMFLLGLWPALALDIFNANMSFLALELSF